ncbi:hypothetical protein HB999_07515 [Listeria booriae]|uniref:hypothetical protein n=1 Tax=Listeria booriae TaxID=1552123 RepID=UPI00164DCE33|nr:hypothetical protein [Listeria booriae]MBC6163314.1 hypothetical protein [Listeria booriae]
MTENEKDRELLDEVFYQMRDGGTQIINDVSKVQLAKLFDLAHRLLTEREKAETVYRAKMLDNSKDYHMSDLSDFIKEPEKYSIRGYYPDEPFFTGDVVIEKGIWVPIEEGLIE